VDGLLLDDADGGGGATGKAGADGECGERNAFDHVGLPLRYEKTL
jgi:hypothetical protein